MVKRDLTGLTSGQ